MASAAPPPRAGHTPSASDRQQEPPPVSRGFALELGRRLREIRIQQGLSLHGVEVKSRGRWKTALLGSYERADRMINTAQLSQLAAFYGVPMSALLPEGTAPARERRARVVLNLERFAQAPAEAALLRGWVRQICAQRGDYAGRVLSIRHGDVNALAVLYDTTAAELTELLRDWDVLDGDGPKPST